MDPKSIAEFIQNNTMGCRFVGVSSDNEIFIEFDHEDPDLEAGTSKLIKENFPNTSTVVTVVRPNIQQMTQMVNDLNESLRQMKDNDSQKQLLDIGEF